LPSETDTKDTEAAVEDDARQDEDKERSDAPRDEARHDEQQKQQSHGNVLGTVLKGAAVGGAAGAALGAWAAFARSMWPEQIDGAAKAVSGTVRDVGRSAAKAAGETLDPAALAELLPGNGDRAEVVKRSARDAATAAAKAAREAITSLNEKGG
jgi:hypothetical protein